MKEIPHNKEGCEKLFDNNTDTKWLSNLDGNSNPGVVICCPFFAFLDVPHLKQIHACAHIHTCDTLFAGEAMALACFSFGKISGKFLKKSVEISPGFCYNTGVSLCPCAGG